MAKFCFFYTCSPTAVRYSCTGQKTGSSTAAKFTVHQLLHTRNGMEWKSDGKVLPREVQTKKARPKTECCCVSFNPSAVYRHVAKGKGREYVFYHFLFLLSPHWLKLWYYVSVWREFFLWLAVLRSWSVNVLEACVEVLFLNIYICTLTMLQGRYSFFHTKTPTYHVQLLLNNRAWVEESGGIGKCLFQCFIHTVCL